MKWVGGVLTALIAYAPSVLPLTPNERDGDAAVEESGTSSSLRLDTVGSATVRGFESLRRRSLTSSLYAEVALEFYGCFSSSLSLPSHTHYLEASAMQV